MPPMRTSSAIAINAASARSDSSAPLAALYLGGVAGIAPCKCFTSFDLHPQKRCDSERGAAGESGEYQEQTFAAKCSNNSPNKRTPSTAI